MTERAQNPLPGVRVLHVVYAEIMHSVVDSQVIEPLAALWDRGLSVQLVAFVTPRVLVSRRQRREHKERLLKLRRRLPGVPVRMMVHTPRHRGAFVSSRRLARAFTKQDRGQPTIVHARGSFAAGVAGRLLTRLPQGALVFDHRGDAAAELSTTRRRGKDGKLQVRSRRARKLAAIERNAVQAADRILTVSQALADHDVSEYGATPGHIRVQGTVVDTARFCPDAAPQAEVRQELGIPGDARVLVYAGSHAPWQLPHAVAGLAASATQDARTHLLLLTRDEGPFRDACLAAGVPDDRVHCKAVNFDLMPRYLSAANAGILLREDSQTNAVASPVKAAEYLACGLPILITQGIGDTSARVTSERAGAVVRSLDADGYGAALAQLEELLAEGNPVHARCARLARENHDLRGAIDRLVQDYQGLALALSDSPLG